VLLFIQLRTKIKHSKTTDQSKFKFIPIYLVVIPVALLIIQLTLAKSFTDQSRNRAIINAAHYINDITSFYEEHGHYPESLQAVHFDYYPQITGIEKYYYLPFRDSYNLSFEQPRFLFDKIGTREWVVYNPKDEHRVYSHTSVLLLLSPDELERSQGWYASGNSTHAHWKYFLFD